MKAKTNNKIPNYFIIILKKIFLKILSKVNKNLEHRIAGHIIHVILKIIIKSKNMLKTKTIYKSLYILKFSVLYVLKISA